MKLVRNVDALAIVLRGFDCDLLRARDPLGDLREVEDELLVADMIVVEKRLERIEAGYKKGRRPRPSRPRRPSCGGPPPTSMPESIRILPLEPDEETTIRGFQFLKKQALVILNFHEALYKKNEAILEEIGKR